MIRVPAWVKIAIPVVLLSALVVTAVLKVLLEELPDEAQVEALQARFSPQLAFLREAAADHPFDACGEDRGTPEEVVEEVAIMKAWWERVEEKRFLFDDPAILGAEVVFYCGGSTKSYVIKEYHEPSGSVSRSMLRPIEHWPAVSMWHAGADRMVRYEDRVGEPSAPAKGFRLTLDLDRLSRSD